MVTASKRIQRRQPWDEVKAPANAWKGSIGRQLDRTQSSGEPKQNDLTVKSSNIALKII